jgi:hypothetical protein
MANYEACFYKHTKSINLCIFKKGYQPRSNLVKDKNGDLLTDSNNILNKWKNYFSKLLIVCRFSDVRQIEIDTAEQLVPEPSPSEIETDIAKLKRYNDYHLLGDDAVWLL